MCSACNAGPGRVCVTGPASKYAPGSGKGLSRRGWRGRGKAVDLSTALAQYNASKEVELVPAPVRDQDEGVECKWYAAKHDTDTWFVWKA
eukprot:CAMPEP_0202924890 /NCGR_PEP_ID=MMETSP1392-20130828/79213_1 /ASSEMBLY_ACC=CAM_ASM_000868 /TAXON_ID=225041 /ORGANISM="Chlamydomonas chlamydogama, Strain SAG 11-48b" /LENGTH=89 /DNA_ID=CAMNT_0049618647 /DNA_START=152 /DNA_END=421 /DNA_ORIENTATION=-